MLRRSMQLLFFIAFILPSFAQNISAVENYAINRPGVVMVKTVFSANVYVNKMKMDNKKFNQSKPATPREVKVELSVHIFSPNQDSVNERAERAKRRDQPKSRNV